MAENRNNQILTKTLKGGEMMKVRYLRLVAFLLILFIVSSIFTGCGTKKEASSNNNQSTGEKKTVELVMGHPFSAQHPVSQQILIPLAKELEEKSGGRIKLTIHPGGSVTSAATIRDDVVSGAIDIGWTLQGYTPGKYPITDLLELPFMFDSTLQASYVLWNLYKRSPEFQQEYGDVVVLGLWVTDPSEFLTKKPVKKPDDLKGMRIRVGGPSREAMIKKLGGTPLVIPMPDVYDAMQRGIIDGDCNGPSVVESYKLHEVIKYATRGLRAFHSAQVIFMNKDKWNSLSPEDQKLLESLTGEVIYKKATEIYNAGYEKGMNMAVKSNVVITEITPEQRKEWMEKTKDLINEWLNAANQKGIPGQKILDLVNQLKEEFNSTQKS
ncbi:TRAP-type C4-dicarboxylate transport system, substrate-binding protein [Caldanaerovirga acetigignens]|uniref:TRAP-type C4-dicarboxylate transport system, substrate-binding protein n=2 Tax=Caldanaerovirga acetigignens TaxID=447595 RepID=A0A1M7IAH5_9FIRM|nr:TRAP-type C4-dicarboxylate transport system, substrate-binding protein [Caldanaerovirga acetigignens]